MQGSLGLGHKLTLTRTHLQKTAGTARPVVGLVAFAVLPSSFGETNGMDLSIASAVGTLVNFLIGVRTAFRNVAQSNFWILLPVGCLLLLDSILCFLFAVSAAEPQHDISVG